MENSYQRLRCEYRENPLGLDVLQPRLSWQVASSARNVRQSAWQVLVADSLPALASQNGNLWDSGKVLSDSSIQIEYAGCKLTSRQRCFWKVRIWDADDQPWAWSIAASWTMGLLAAGEWTANWIGLDTGDDAPSPPIYLRKEFVLGDETQSASVHVTALGLYELSINGTRVGDHLLAPEWTDYRKRVQYQTYGVGHLLTSGSNVIAAILGRGWYAGDWQFWESKLRPIYGKEPRLLAQLEVELKNGSRQVIQTDGSWLASCRGPLRFSGIYEGETYDARMEMPGWKAAGFDDSAWQPVSVGSPHAGKLVWQRSEPIRVTQELTPIRITEPLPAVYVFDFGQNMAGWCRWQVDEPAGTVVTLFCNEMLNPDGTVYLENLHSGHASSGDRQVLRYTACDQSAVYEPRFTYQGFRYVEVHGLTKPPTPDFLTARVFHTSFARTGSFQCSHALLDRLAENIQWSQRSNIMGIPTDCCQRDERCGYTGDMNFFMPTAVYNFEMAAFFNKWLVDLCQDSQMPDGHFADHAPTYGPGDEWNVGWSDAGLICPYLMYRTYGDRRVIREHYAAMRKNILLQIDTATSTGIRGLAGVGNGDWLNLGGGATHEVIDTAYHAYGLRIFSEMAAAVGEEEDAAEFGLRAEQVARSFGDLLIDEEDRVKDSSQTGYALAFTMGLVPSEMQERVSERFAKEIARFDNHLATGFIGTPRLLPGLHLAGRDDLAGRLLLATDYPSWLHPVTLGATTVWERWDGWTSEKGFADPAMNSFNHYAFGSVGEYLFRVVGGIGELAPGYKKISFHPVFLKELTWAKTSFDCPYGLISSQWRRTGGRVEVDLTIPANTTAEVVLPGGEDVDGLESARLENGWRVFQIGSGGYHFTCADPQVSAASQT